MSPPALSSKIKGLRFMQRAAESKKGTTECGHVNTHDIEGYDQKSKGCVDKVVESWAQEASKTSCVVLRRAGVGSATKSHGKMTFGSTKKQPVDVIDEQIHAVEKDLKRMAEDDVPKPASVTESDNSTKKKKKKRRR